MKCWQFFFSCKGGGAVGLITQLAHLLEFGHAKRGGGRVEGKTHIALAEAKGVEQLQDEIERALRE